MSSTHYRNFDFQELKAKVGVTDVALALGYRIDRKAGVGRYVEMIKVVDGQKLDTLVISNPSSKAAQTFFRRNGERGDAVKLIVENLSSFNVNTGNNKWIAAGEVMAKLANMPSPHEADAETIANAKRSNVFNESRYRTESFDIAEGTPSLLTRRGLSLDTFRQFSPFIRKLHDLENLSFKGLVDDKNSMFSNFCHVLKFKGYNIGFPYTVPGGERPVGYEIRGAGGFKSKAAGTDSQHGLWKGVFSGGSPAMVTNVFFFESAFDAMAFYQRNSLSVDINRSVFVSVGGQLSDGQVQGMLNVYSEARMIDCFDNDIAGRIYGLKMGCIAAGISATVTKNPSGITVQTHDNIFNLPEDSANLAALSKLLPIDGKADQWKAPSGFKDWNDVVLGKRNEEIPRVCKQQRDDALRERRTGLKV